MSRTLFILFLSSLFALTAEAQNSEQRALSGFSRVVIEGDFYVEILQSDTFGVTVSSSDGSPSDVRTRVTGGTTGTLTIDSARSSADPEDFDVLVEMPMLREVRLRSSADIYIGDFDVEQLNLALASSGNITLGRLMADEMSVDLMGSGEMYMQEVSANAVELKIAGSGDIEIAELSTDSLEVAIAGSGDISIDSGRADHVNVRIAGSGDLLAPELRVVTVEGTVAGSGEVEVSTRELEHNTLRNLAENGDLADLITLGLEMGSVWERTSVELDPDASIAISADLDSHDLPDNVWIIGLTATVFAFLTPIVIVALVTIMGYRKRRLRYQTLRDLAASGQPIPDNVMQSLMPETAPDSNMRSGVKLLAIGLGIMAFFVLMGDTDVAAVGCIPAFIGVAKLLIWKLETRKD